MAKAPIQRFRPQNLRILSLLRKQLRRTPLPTFSEKGYTRLWGLSTKSTGSVSGSADTDTGYYAVKWWDGSVETKTSGAGFSKAAAGGKRAFEVYPCDAAGDPSGQFDSFTLSNNSLVSLRAEDVALEAGSGGYTQTVYPYSYISNPVEAGSIANNALSSQALDQFYTDLLAGGGDLFVQGNPGIDADDPTIATAKGYTVFGSVPPSTSLLLNFNGTNGSSVFTDSSPNQLSVTAYSATISTAPSKFGGSSAYFDGTGYLEIAPGEWCDFAGMDFTIEFWYRSVPGQGEGSGASGTGILSFGWDSVSATAPVMLYRDGSDIWLYSDLYGWGSAQIAAASIDDGQWHHIAICGTPSVVQAYLDGTQTISTSASAAWQNPTNNVTVGASADGLLRAVAYIDDLRIIKGAAIYTGPFAPPASQLGVYP